jgi:hypothetical protein
MDTKRSRANFVQKLEQFVSLIAPLCLERQHPTAGPVL